jgi:hypothetical protein
VEDRRQNAERWIVVGAKHPNALQNVGGGNVVIEHDGPMGGAYYFTDLSDGRRMAISRKRGDSRVWLGNPDERYTWKGQRGGIGTIRNLEADWFHRIVSDAEARECYYALRALVREKGDGE